MAGETRWGKRSRLDDPDQARNHILSATYHVVTNKGVDKTTISEIAKQAKVSRPTIYRYFDSRDEIIQCLLNKRQGDFFERMYEETVRYRNDFPRLVEELLCFAQQFTARNRASDLVSGPNAGRMVNYFPSDEAERHFAKILDEPYQNYRYTTGNVVDLESLKGFLGVMMLSIRLYPYKNHETLRNQLQAIMALGRTASREESTKTFDSLQKNTMRNSR